MGGCRPGRQGTGGGQSLTKVDLLVELVGLESFRDTKNGIRRTLGNGAPGGHGAVSSQVASSRARDSGLPGGDSERRQHHDGLMDTRLDGKGQQGVLTRKVEWKEKGIAFFSLSQTKGGR
jgi:hypothetical protein